MKITQARVVLDQFRQRRTVRRGRKECQETGFHLCCGREERGGEKLWTSALSSDAHQRPLNIFRFSKLFWGKNSVNI